MLINLLVLAIVSAQNLQFEINQDAVSLLKDQILPIIFSKIETISLPPIGIDNKWFGVNLTNPVVTISTTGVGFNNDFDLQLEANGTEPILRVKAEKLPLVISSDWDMHFSVLKSHGKIEADFVNVGFTMGIQLSTILN